MKQLEKYVALSLVIIFLKTYDPLLQQQRGYLLFFLLKIVPHLAFIMLLFSKCCEGVAFNSFVAISKETHSCQKSFKLYFISDGKGRKSKLSLSMNGICIPHPRGAIHVLQFPKFLKYFFVFLLYSATFYELKFKL